MPERLNGSGWAQINLDWNNTQDYIPVLCSLGIIFDYIITFLRDSLLDTTYIHRHGNRFRERTIPQVRSLKYHLFYKPILSHVCASRFISETALETLASPRNLPFSSLKTNTYEHRSTYLQLYNILIIFANDDCRGPQNFPYNICICFYL